jgi:acetyl esterase/lipase
VKTQLRRFDGVFHGFALMGNTIAKGREALELEAQFVRQQLR